MERWRWLPRDLGAFYVTVNIPEFMLRVAADDGPVYTTRVVVGKPDTPTPVLSNEMRTVVFGPYWRSEEHTSELQSLMRISYAVFCLIKKNTFLFFTFFS